MIHLETTAEMLDQIYQFICAYKTDHDGNSPSIREIADRFERSTSVVNYYIKKLESSGKLRRSGAVKARHIEVVGGIWLHPEKGS